MMNVAVVGLGHVGSVTAACLAQHGHKVWGVEKSEEKRQQISSGQSVVHEPGLQEVLADAIRKGRLQVTGELDQAVREAEVSLICVGTPTTPGGELGTQVVQEVVESIYRLVEQEDLGRHLIMIRSTLPPGTCSRLWDELRGSDHEDSVETAALLLFNPEFMREGSAVDDFSSPPFLVFGFPGGASKRDASIRDRLDDLYHAVAAPVIELGYEEAELLKLASNSFHALKVAFANEVGSLAHAVGADPDLLMRAFVQDTQLNVSDAYLRPGFAFGGSCLPKDVRAVASRARARGLELPLHRAILDSNERHLQRIAESICAREDCSVVGLAGATFKEGTDDLRESPSLRLARRLIDSDVEVLIYEPTLNVDELETSNNRYLTEMIPAWKRRFVDWGEFRTRVELCLVSRSELISKAEADFDQVFYLHDLDRVLKVEGRGARDSKCLVTQER